MKSIHASSTVKWSLVVASLISCLTLFAAQPARAAITSFPDSTAVVYLTGTSMAFGNLSQCGAGDWPFRAQNDVRLLHRRLVKDLKAVNRNTSSLNYYCAGSRVRDDRVGLELPQVVSVVNKKSTRSTCLGAAQKSWDAGQDGTGVPPVMRHAYHVAWQLSEDAKSNPSRRFLLIGHSQGGIIARLVFILSDPARRSALASVLGTGLIRTECWPANLAGKFYGQVYMGTPFRGIGLVGGLVGCSGPLPSTADPWALDEICEINDQFSIARRILDRHRDLSAPNTMQFGGWNAERVFDDFATNIPAGSSTGINNGQRFVLIAQPVSTKPKTLMRHSDWWDITTGGRCPTTLINSKQFCEYSPNPENAVATRRLLYKLGSSSEPGNVYDLMIRSMLTAWNSP